MKFPQQKLAILKFKSISQLIDDQQKMMPQVFIHRHGKVLQESQDLAGANKGDEKQRAFLRGDLEIVFCFGGMEQKLIGMERIGSRVAEDLHSPLKAESQLPGVMLMRRGAVFVDLGQVMSRREFADFQNLCHVVFLKGYA